MKTCMKRGRGFGNNLFVLGDLATVIQTKENAI